MKKRINLKGRSLLKISDLSDDELIYLLDLADRLKRKKKRGCTATSCRARISR